MCLFTVYVGPAFVLQQTYLSAAFLKAVVTQSDPAERNMYVLVSDPFHIVALQHIWLQHAYLIAAVFTGGMLRLKCGTISTSIALDINQRP